MTTVLDNGLAFLFPGQGSQSVGMLKELAAEHPEVQATFAEASQVLGIDLWKMTSEGPAEQLNLTENTQPAMLAAGVAAWRVWRKCSPVLPGWMAGHSLGEYTALVCAESIEFAAAIGLVRERARLMQSAVPAGVGAMAAILGLDDPQVVGLCSQISSDAELVAPANFNSPGQIVVAGHAAAVNRLIEAAKEQGAKRAVLLPVSVPSHCPLMEEASERFRAALEAVAVETPKIPVVHNVDVVSHAAPEVIRAVLAKQLCGSVRWSDSVRFMHEQGAHRFVECGPGKVLMGLGKRIVEGPRFEALFSPDSLAKSVELVK
ncbi:ACP S-malonyltransferase [Methyloterricola oryzae]|uniref:ACP S-malonyltransferase n=1 Tax=Methyloterricola oryzae TaxID=1495050 RepID=UPI0005EB0DAE|nr:ACP S-malonyltransferase [Methyloterricola oryzae]